MQNYAKAVLKKIDERFYTESVTEPIINKGMRFEFSGVNTVTIYDVDVVPENDYVRDGYHRFGDLIELGTGQQDFTLSQDKSFTFSVDRGNLEDSMHAQEIHKAVKRQVREVSVPTTDRYRLATIHAYAVANSQFQNETLTKTTTYSRILAQQVALIDAEVPHEDSLYIYMTATVASLLAVDPEYKLSGDASYKDNKTGLPSRVAGMTIKIVPSSYLPTNTNFIVIHQDVLISPTKFNSIRVHENPMGIDGSVAEGRRYYDAFITKAKGKAIRVSKTS